MSLWSDQAAGTHILAPSSICLSSHPPLSRRTWRPSTGLPWLCSVPSPSEMAGECHTSPFRHIRPESHTWAVSSQSRTQRLSYRLCPPWAVGARQGSLKGSEQQKKKPPSKG